VIRTPPSFALGEAPEAAVVALAMGGDDAAYGELVRRRQGAIRNLFRRLCRDAALADDLSQQAFLLAWKSIRTLKSPSAFGAWMRKLAVNCWLQQVRARKHEVALGEAALRNGALDEAAQRTGALGEAALDGSTLDAELVAEGGAASAVTERLDLDAALARLPPDARLCVVLAYSEGMSHAEISDSTSIPLGTVKSHIARGAARLRELLQAYGGAHGR
jgi:RNA polymerase sigma-70 factor (ECF subfamily)